MGYRASTLKVPGKGTNRSNAYRARILAGEDGAKVWDDVWLCQHLHDNRDHDANHAVSARTCAEYAIKQFRQDVTSPGADAAALKRWLEVQLEVQPGGGSQLGLFLLADAAKEQLDWLAGRAKDIRAGRVSNAGNRAAYPEQWVTLEDGRRYRGKLWEKDDPRQGELRRLFVAGPFGEDEYLEGYVDLATFEVHVRNRPEGALVPLGWQEAAKKLEWALSEWAPKSRSAQEEFTGKLRVPKAKVEEDERADLSLPAVYRVRVRREGAKRLYDIVEKNSDEVFEEGLTSRVQAYRRVEDLAKEQRKTRVKAPQKHWADNYLRNDEVWTPEILCDHCTKKLFEYDDAWFLDHVDGGGMTYCSYECGFQSIKQLDHEIVENEYINYKEQVS